MTPKPRIYLPRRRSPAPAIVATIRSLVLAAGVLAGLLLFGTRAPAQTQQGEPRPAEAPVSLTLARVSSRGARVDSIRLVLSAEADSALTTDVDQATKELAWCLAGHADSASRTLTIDSAYTPSKLRSYPDSTFATCPAGAGLAHLHMLDRGHTDGPSEIDLHGAGEYPFELVVVRQRDRRHLKFYVFSVRHFDG